MLASKVALQQELQQAVLQLMACRLLASLAPCLCAAVQRTPRDLLKAGCFLGDSILEYFDYFASHDCPRLKAITLDTPPGTVRDGYIA